MVAVARDLVPDGVFPGVRAGGDGLGVGAVLAETVKKLAVGGGTRIDQRLGVAAVDQAVHGRGRGIRRRDGGNGDGNRPLRREVIDRIVGGEDNGLRAGVGCVDNRLPGLPAPRTRHILAVKGGALAGDRADGNSRAGVVHGDAVRQGQNGGVPLRQGEDDRNGGVLVVLGANQKGEGDDVAGGNALRQRVGDRAGVHVNAPTVLNLARGRIGPAVERVRVGHLCVIGHSQTLEVGEGDGLLRFQSVLPGDRIGGQHGRGGLGDGETGRIVGCKSVTDRFGAFRLALKHIVVVRKRHGEGKGLSVSDVRRGQVAPVRLLHGKLGVREGERRIGELDTPDIRRLAEERQPARGKRDVCGAVVGLGDSLDGEKADRQRGNGYGERTGSRFVVCCFRFVVNGVRACVGESRSVRSIVAVYLVAVGERHGSAVYTLPKCDCRCVLRLAGVIRAGCPHGNSRQLCRFDCDGHGAGRGGVFFVAFRRGERPFGVIAARVGLDGAVLPRERTRNHGLCAGADHRTRGRECALCQRLAVGDIRRADADARLIEGDPLANDDLDGQLERLIVRAYNRDGQSADLIVHIRSVRGHDGQSQNASV